MMSHAIEGMVSSVDVMERGDIGQFDTRNDHVGAGTLVESDLAEAVSRGLVNVGKEDRAYCVYNQACSVRSLHFRFLNGAVPLIDDTQARPDVV